jgi:predicted neuraminidase
LLSNGDILAGTSVEAGYGPDTPNDAPYRSWAVWVERSSDAGRTWHKHGPITMPGQPYGVIQPTLWETASGEVHMFMRSTDRIRRICESVSRDGGRTWTPAYATHLPNPSAGIDVARLGDGRLVLVYNHRTRGRGTIHLAVSEDQGATWGAPYLLEGDPQEAGSGYSYPAVIQASDGLLHITYTWRRKRIRYVVIDPEDI